MNLFVYGTLIFEEILFALLQKRYISIPGLLRNHAIKKFSSAEYPGIIPDITATVSGKIIFDISQNDISILDTYEGIMYQRTKIAVSTNSEYYKCQTYLVKDRYKAKLSQAAWCPLDFQKNSLKHYLENLK